MKLEPQFTEFLTEIRPTAAQREGYQIGYKELKRKLRADLELDPIIESIFIQGSIRRATAVRPVNDKKPDVDLVVVTNLDRLKVTAHDAIETFVPFVEKNYKDKWERQGRSIGITMSRVLLDIVVTALPDADDLKMLKWSSVSTLATLEEALDWRLAEEWLPEEDRRDDPFGLVEARVAKAAEWKAKPLWIPDRDAGHWQETHPLEQIRWTADKNRRCNGHYVNVVKAGKWLRHQDPEMPKYPKGYPFEHLMGYCCPDGIESVAEGLTLTLEKITSEYQSHATREETPVLPDHGVPAHDVLKRIDGADFAKFHTRISEAAKTARAALDHDDAVESAKLWQELFGSRFPDPPERGGDKGGFTPRTKTTAVASTPRFA